MFFSSFFYVKVLRVVRSLDSVKLFPVRGFCFVYHFLSDSFPFTNLSKQEMMKTKL